jgi:6-phosphogluconolactonase
MSESGSQPSFREFATADDANADLAGAIVARLAAGVAQRGRGSLVVSGGTTPGSLFDVLARREAPWADVTITLSDERWVDPASERSNENLVRRHLLAASAAAAHFVPLKTPHPRAGEAEGETGARIAALPRPFDVVLLGMGADGHTASLIPGSGGLAGALDQNDPALVRAIEPPAATGMGPRLTLTLRALLDARWIALLIRGDDKRATYRHALAGDDVLEAPVRAILLQGTVPVTVYWSP